MKQFRLFPGIVFALIGANATVVGITVYLANSDKSFAVEPDYYQKALTWDEHVQEQARSRALGWTMRVEPGAIGVAGRRAQIVIQDREGKPVEGARVKATAFPVIRASERVAMEFEALEPGVYRADVALRDTGAWEFDIRATRDGQTCSDRIRASIPGPNS